LCRPEAQSLWLGERKPLKGAPGISVDEYGQSGRGVRFIFRLADVIKIKSGRGEAAASGFTSPPTPLHFRSGGEGKAGAHSRAFTGDSRCAREEDTILKWPTGLAPRKPGHTHRTHRHKGRPTAHAHILYSCIKGTGQNWIRLQIRPPQHKSIGAALCASRSRQN